ncbi:MAG: hypothetical protein J6N21_20075 [Butyrivibrio sp.]|nr:hypothetical protein [Butyrivibrio sp.]
MKTLFSKETKKDDELLISPEALNDEALESLTGGSNKIIEDIAKKVTVTIINSTMKKK